MPRLDLGAQALGGDGSGGVAGEAERLGDLRAEQ
jgi:hypothetical protein